MRFWRCWTLTPGPGVRAEKTPRLTEGGAAPHMGRTEETEFFNVWLAV
jgi:hypothetical protein